MTSAFDVESADLSYTNSSSIGDGAVAALIQSVGGSVKDDPTPRSGEGLEPRNKQAVVEYEVVETRVTRSLPPKLPAGLPTGGEENAVNARPPNKEFGVSDC